MRRFWLLIGFVLASLMSLPSLAQDLTPLIDGEVVDVSVSTPPFEPGDVADQLHWIEKFEQWPGSRELRLRFGDIAVPAGTDVRVVIRSRGGRIIEDLSGPLLASMSGQWSLSVPGDYAEVLVLAAAPPVGFSLEIDGVLHTVWPSVELSIIGPSNLRPIRDFASNPLVSGLSPSVAKLRFIVNGKSYTCTGFLIGRTQLTTNEHCVNSSAMCRDTFATFGHEVDSNGSELKGEEFRCRRFVTANAGLDFAILAFDRTAAQKYGRLRLSNAALASGQLTFAIQHPGGRPKEIAYDDCALDRIGVNGAGPRTDASHSCDTEKGSSGSPVIARDGRVVALHHFGTDAAFPKANRAVLMSLILRDLQLKGIPVDN